MMIMHIILCIANGDCRLASAGWFIPYEVRSHPHYTGVAQQHY